MRDGFDELRFSDAVLLRPFQVKRKLLGVTADHEGRYRDQAPIALRKLGALPDVAEKDLIRTVSGKTPLA